MYTIHVDQGTEILDDAYKVRFRVFCKEQGVAPEVEADDFDREALHVVVYDQEDPVGTGRLIIENEMFKIGRVCVLPDYRGQGIGEKMMALLLDIAKENRGIKERVYIDSQVSAIPFYEKFGFEAYGDTYVKEGIDHQNMVIELREWRREDA